MKPIPGGRSHWIRRALVLLPTLALISPIGRRGLAAESSPPLQWEACQNEALASYGYKCATVPRPLRRSEPDGPQVKLAVYGLPATRSDQERIGTLFFNPGGPGQPGGGSAIKGMFLPPDVRRAFDLVTWDPQGLGLSRPVLANCAVSMPRRPATRPVDWQQVLKQRQSELSERNRDCIARHRALIPQMGTVEVVHNLEALRQTVGDDRLTFWGVSYWNRAGFHLCGAVPPASACPANPRKCRPLE